MDLPQYLIGKIIKNKTSAHIEVKSSDVQMEQHEDKDILVFHIHTFDLENRKEDIQDGADVRFQPHLYRHKNDSKWDGYAHPGTLKFRKKQV